MEQNQGSWILGPICYKLAFWVYIKKHKTTSPRLLLSTERIGCVISEAPFSFNVGSFVYACSDLPPLSGSWQSPLEGFSSSQDLSCEFYPSRGRQVSLCYSLEHNRVAFSITYSVFNYFPTGLHILQGRNQCILHIIVPMHSGSWIYTSTFKTYLKFPHLSGLNSVPISLDVLLSNLPVNLITFTFKVSWKYEF